MLDSFLKYRAPCAAARSLAANARSLPRGPPTAASPALWGAPRRRRRLQPGPSLLHPPPQHGIAQAKLLGHRSDRAPARRYEVNRLPLVVVRKRPTLTSFHPTPPGSSSLLQVSINSEEVQSCSLHSRAACLGASCALDVEVKLLDQWRGAHLAESRPNAQVLRPSLLRNKPRLVAILVAAMAHSRFGSISGRKKGAVAESRSILFARLLARRHRHSAGTRL
ncbi:hypothetical protein ABIF23_006204 [Bradyrhizobium elkanii]